MIINTSVLLDKKKIRLIKSNLKTSLKKDKVLVKILYSGICRSQFMEIDMKRGKDKFLPHTFGPEAVGIVVKIGSNIKKIKVKEFISILYLSLTVFYGRNLFKKCSLLQFSWMLKRGKYYWKRILG